MFLPNDGYVYQCWVQDQSWSWFVLVLILVLSYVQSLWDFHLLCVVLISAPLVSNPKLTCILIWIIHGLNSKMAKIFVYFSMLLNALWKSYFFPLMVNVCNICVWCYSVPGQVQVDSGIFLWQARSLQDAPGMDGHSPHEHHQWGQQFRPKLRQWPRFACNLIETSY